MSHSKLYKYLFVSKSPHFLNNWYLDIYSISSFPSPSFFLLLFSSFSSLPHPHLHSFLSSQGKSTLRVHMCQVLHLVKNCTCHHCIKMNKDTNWHVLKFLLLVVMIQRTLYIGWWAEGFLQETEHLPGWHDGLYVCIRNRSPNKGIKMFKNIAHRKL